MASSNATSESGVTLFVRAQAGAATTRLTGQGKKRCHRKRCHWPHVIGHMPSPDVASNRGVKSSRGVMAPGVVKDVASEGSEHFKICRQASIEMRTPTADRPETFHCIIPFYVMLCRHTLHYVVLFCILFFCLTVLTKQYYATSYCVISCRYVSSYSMLFCVLSNFTAKYIIVIIPFYNVCYNIIRLCIITYHIKLYCIPFFLTYSKYFSLIR